MTEYSLAAASAGLVWKVGDTVIHPAYGAGVVIDIKELEFLGNKSKPYYSIELLSQPATVVMVALRNAEKVGLRAPVPQSKLSQLWRVLHADPRSLPSDHKERYALLKDKLHGGDVFQIAEALRDLAWKKEQKGGLTTEGKRLYEQAMRFLSAEIASTQGSDLSTTEVQISSMLRKAPDDP